MSCVLLATLGSLGDLHPYIAVGKALVARGQRVRLATSSDYRARVEAAGLEFAPLAPSLTELGEPSHIARQFFAGWAGPRRLIDAMVATPLRRACADLRAAMQGAALVVSHPLTAALPLLAESRELPWLSSVLAPYSLFSMSDPSVIPKLEWLQRFPRAARWLRAPLLHLVHTQVRRWERPLHVLRTELGFSPVRETLLMGGQFSPLGTLALFDPVLTAPQPDWPPQTFLCGAALYDAADPEHASGEWQEKLEDFLASGPPPLVFALGSSAVWLAQDYWQHAIAACQTLGRRGLLLTGMPLQAHLPAAVAAFEYLPYSRVFPRAAAVIHQAGIGTLSQALRSGRPQLLTPAGFDQPDNAARAARLGAGRVLPFQRAHSEARLVRELRALLDDPAYERVAIETAERLRGVNGAAAAAQRITTIMGGTGS
ncbi:MAG TPA: nucleotide disphospho-sugar-binding domain-containing protein [Steroidobacteraceae bacterium]|jgi:UDP:flavonoid glycosyltransferase YjiC (YdhE family)|nr:nucleotide disphospho-sugar-binding domain-containing protein [Steroidobacteraceae bacterium]